MGYDFGTARHQSIASSALASMHCPLRSSFCGSACLLTNWAGICERQQFTVMESFFTGKELETLVRGVEAVAFRNWGVESAEQADARKLPPTGQISPAKAIYPGYTSGIDEVFLDLIDHDRILPYVVDSLGWNIHMRDALFTPQVGVSSLLAGGRRTVSITSQYVDGCCSGRTEAAVPVPPQPTLTNYPLRGTSTKKRSLPESLRMGSCRWWISRCPTT